MLSNRQVCILKYLYPDKRINENELYKHFNVNIEDKVIQALLKNKLIFIESYSLYRKSSYIRNWKEIAQYSRMDKHYNLWISINYSYYCFNRINNEMIAIIKATNDVIVCIHKKRLCFLLSIFSTSLFDFHLYWTYYLDCLDY